MKLRSRDTVRQADTWDLSSLFASTEDWELGLKRFQKTAKKFAGYRGRLSESPQRLAECLALDSAVDRLGERLGVFAMLKVAQDQTNSDSHELMGRFQSAATKASEAASFIRPEVMAMSPARVKRFCRDKAMAPYRLLIERWERYRAHTLSEGEEQLLAMQGEMAQASSKVFRQLLDADMKFGTVEDEQGRKVELSHATFSQLLLSPQRRVRKRAFQQYYTQFAAHENSLAAALTSSVHKDIYYARARKFPSALHAALFGDNVPVTVYERLIDTVRSHLPALHRYYEIRRKKMRLEEIHHYDTYVPLLPELSRRRTWQQASKTILSALAPLGDEYCGVLEAGLNGRWCDRYPNRGKQSGAFSCGTYDADPYILMNYKPEVLDDMFTLAHEAGHSMHSYFSAKHQPFEYYNYTIFVAEVASTFNEQLLSAHLLSQAEDDRERAYLINRDIDAIRGTIIRQTMFAEFEQLIHSQAEQGQALTVASLKQTYRGLLQDYFGPAFALDDQLDLECLRIPHFYRAFYVYKYATGLSAAIALSHRVLSGGSEELEAYLSFLKGGCSKFPIELLRDAGVDMERPQPVNAALQQFERLVDELDSLL